MVINQTSMTFSSIPKVRCSLHGLVEDFMTIHGLNFCTRCLGDLMLSQLPYLPKVKPLHWWSHELWTSTDFPFPRTQTPRS